MLKLRLKSAGIAFHNRKQVFLGQTRPAVTWTDYLHARYTGLDPNYRGMDKIASRQTYLDAGLRVPELYGRFASAAEVDFAGLPDRFVLKMTNGWTTRGVLVLRREGADSFREDLSRRSMTRSDIIAHLDAEQRRFRSYGPTLLAEERLSGEDGEETIVPVDYKLYTFGTAVPLVSQVNRNCPPYPYRPAFHFNEFTETDTAGRIVATVNPMLPAIVPKCAPEMVAAARAVAARLRTPFVRVDCYATPKGVVMGEITMTPGSGYFQAYRFSEALERELGAKWRAADEALGRSPPLVPRDYRKILPRGLLVGNSR